MKHFFSTPVVLWATSGGAFAQKLPPVTTDTALANGALYLPDTADYTKFGTGAGPVAAAHTEWALESELQVITSSLHY